MQNTPPYPLQLTGELSPRLSRGLWLVKWLLAIPHCVVLLFLWIGFAVVSVVAFFAILFTGRYPRGPFEPHFLRVAGASEVGTRLRN